MTVSYTCDRCGLLIVENQYRLMFARAGSVAEAFFDLCLPCAMHVRADMKKAPDRSPGPTD